MNNTIRNALDSLDRAIARHNQQKLDSERDEEIATGTWLGYDSSRSGGNHLILTVQGVVAADPISNGSFYEGMKVAIQIRDGDSALFWCMPSGLP